MSERAPDPLERARAHLDSLETGNVPVEEHAGVYEKVHELLSEALQVTSAGT